jgi:hypothetical protein
VVPTGNPPASPAVVQSTGIWQIVGSAAQFTLNGSNVVTAFQRSAIVYLAAGGDGNIHLYGLPLVTSGSVPAPVQLSNLSLPSLTSICISTWTAQSNLLDPTSLFVVLGTSTETNGICGVTQFQVVHWGDGPTLAPTAATLPNTSSPATGAVFTAALYKPSGTLGGLIVRDDAGNLNFYNGESFSAPQILTTGVQSWSVLYESSMLTNGNLSGGTVDFLDVKTASGESLWRVTSTGAANVVYTASGRLGGGIGDANNVYFYDAILSANKQNIYQQAIDSTVPQNIELYSASGISEFPYTEPAVTIEFPVQLIGSNGSVLVFQSNTYDGYPESSTLGPTSVTFQTVPVATSASGPETPSTILGPSSNGTVFMAAPSYTDFASRLLYLYSYVSGAYSSEVLMPNGTIVQQPLANSSFLSPVAFQPGATSGSVYFGPILQLQYGSGPSSGDATVAAFNVDSGTATPLVAPGGQPYQISAYQISAGDLGSPLTLANGLETATIPSPSGTTSDALVIESSLGVIAEIPFNNQYVLGF